MSRPVQFIDQTLNVAIQNRIPQNRLLLMAELLQSLKFHTLDVSLGHLTYYCLPQALLNNVRATMRPSINNVNTAYRAGLRQIAIVYRHKNEQADPKLKSALRRARQLEIKVSLKIENASAISIEDIVTLCNQLKDFEIESLIYEDNDSLLDNFGTDQTLKELANLVEYPLEFHGHDRYNLATANTLSALRAGIRRVATAIAGEGRPKHAPFEEVFMAGKNLLKVINNELVQELAPACAKVIAFMGKAIPVEKAIIGNNIFAHESGLHVCGIMRSSKTYEAFSPLEVGLARYLVIGKHSGSISLQTALRRLGIRPDCSKVEKLRQSVRRAVIAKKGHLTPQEVLNLYYAEC